MHGGSTFWSLHFDGVQLWGQFHASACTTFPPTPRFHLHMCICNHDKIVLRPIQQHFGKFHSNFMGAPHFCEQTFSRSKIGLWIHQVAVVRLDDSQSTTINIVERLPCCSQFARSYVLHPCRANNPIFSETEGGWGNFQKLFDLFFNRSETDFDFGVMQYLDNLLWLMDVFWRTLCSKHLQRCETLMSLFVRR